MSEGITRKSGLKSVVEFLNRLIRIAALASLTISIVLIGLTALFGPANDRILYPIVFTPLESQVLLGTFCLWIVSGVMLFINLIAAGYIAEMKTEPIEDIIEDMNKAVRSITIIIAAMAIPAANWLSFWFVPERFGSPFGRWAVISEVDFDQNRYLVAYYNHDTSDWQLIDYYLYRCDSLRLMCTEVFEEAGFTLSSQFGGFKVDAPVLLADTSSNEIHQVINDLVAYKYPP